MLIKDNGQEFRRNIDIVHVIGPVSTAELVRYLTVVNVRTWPIVPVRARSATVRKRCFADAAADQSREPRRIKYVSMIHPCAARAAWRSA